MAKSLWPNLVQIFTRIDATRLSFREVLSIMTVMLLCLLVVITFAIVPAWKLWQASAVLRVIPASLMLLGFIALSVMIVMQPPDNNTLLFVLLTMTANFLCAAVSLFLFKNESIEHPDHGISST